MHRRRVLLAIAGLLLVLGDAAMIVDALPTSRIDELLGLVSALVGGFLLFVLAAREPPDWKP